MTLARWFIHSGGTEDARGRMSAHLENGARLPEGYLEAAAQQGAISSPRPGAVPDGFLVGLEFGQLRADTLATLARLGSMRVTPWRMLLIEGATAAAAVPGLITRPDDPLLRVIACTGAPGCRQAVRPTRPLARLLAPHVAGDMIVHISGCAKGCAHPAPASVTLVAGTDGFDLIRNGCARDIPSRSGLSEGVLAGHPETLIEAR